MFAQCESGAACLEDYKGITKGAIVPEINELYAQVREWLEFNDWSSLPDDFGVVKKDKKQLAVAINAECSKRINAHWNQIGQINASLGVYGEEDAASCAAWISSNRAALVALLAREDLLEIDVKDDQYWPVFEGSN